MGSSGENPKYQTISPFKRLSLEEKIEILKYLENHKISQAKAAQTFSVIFNRPVNRMNIYRLLKEKDSLIEEYNRKNKA